jgi:hypothetical protein
VEEEFKRKEENVPYVEDRRGRTEYFLSKGRLRRKRKEMEQMRRLSEDWIGSPELYICVGHYQ